MTDTELIKDAMRVMGVSAVQVGEALDMTPTAIRYKLRNPQTEWTISQALKLQKLLMLTGAEMRRIFGGDVDA